MCHASIDPKFLLSDAEDRYRAAQGQFAHSATEEALETEIPPQFIPGWRGVWARVARVLPRRSAPVVPAE